jgi:hypothetical protein
MKEMIRVLRKAGAAINATNKEGNRSFDLVEEEIINLQTVDCEELIQLLKAQLDK